MLIDPADIYFLEPKAAVAKSWYDTDYKGPVTVTFDKDPKDPESKIVDLQYMDDHYWEYEDSVKEHIASTEGHIYIALVQTWKGNAPVLSHMVNATHYKVSTIFEHFDKVLSPI